MWVILTPCLDILAYSLCLYSHTEIWKSTNCMTLHFVPSDKVVMKVNNGCQTLGWFASANISDIKPTLNPPSSDMRPITRVSI